MYSQHERLSEKGLSKKIVTLKTKRFFMDPINHIADDSWGIIIQHAQVQAINQLSKTCKRFSILFQASLKSLKALYSSSEIAFDSLHRNYSIECRTLDYYSFEKKIENQNIFIANENSKDQEILLQFWDGINRCPFFNFFKKDFELNIYSKTSDDHNPYIFIPKKLNEAKSEELQRKMNSIFKSLGAEQFVVVFEVEKKLILTKILADANYSRGFLCRQDIYCEFKPPVLDIQVIFSNNSALSDIKQSVIILAAKNVLRSLSPALPSIHQDCETQNNYSICTLL